MKKAVAGLLFLALSFLGGTEVFSMDKEAPEGPEGGTHRRAHKPGKGMRKPPSQDVPQSATYTVVAQSPLAPEIKETALGLTTSPSATEESFGGAVASVVGEVRDSSGEAGVLANEVTSDREEDPALEPSQRKKPPKRVDSSLVVEEVSDEEEGNEGPATAALSELLSADASAVAPGAVKCPEEPENSDEEEGNEGGATAAPGEESAEDDVENSSGEEEGAAGDGAAAVSGGDLEEWEEVEVPEGEALADSGRKGKALKRLSRMFRGKARLLASADTGPKENQEARESGTEEGSGGDDLEAQWEQLKKEDAEGLIGAAPVGRVRKLKGPFAELFRSFHQTNVVKVDLGGKRLPHSVYQQLAGSLPTQSTLKELNLRDCNLGASGIGILAPCFGAMATLSVLDISHNHTGPGWLKGVTAPPGVTTLKIAGNELGSRAGRLLAGFVAQMKQLKEIDVRDNALGDEGVGAVLAVVPLSVQVLRLDGNDFGQNPPETAIFSMPPFSKVLSLRRNHINPIKVSFGDQPGVTSLDWGENEIGPEHIPTLVKELPRMLMLRELSLDGNPLGFAVRDLVNACGSLPLRKLNLNRISLGVRGGEALAGALRSLDTLLELYLADNALGDAGVKAFSHLPRCLQVLDISKNEIGPHGVDSLGPVIQAHQHLQALHLGNNKLGDEGIRALYFPRTLTVLNVNHNGITPDGIGVTSRWISCNFEELTLDGNPLGNESIPALLHLPGHMRELSLVNCGIDPRKCGALKKRMKVIF